MKKITNLTFIFLLVAFASFAQLPGNGFEKVGDVSKFKTSLATKYNSVSTLSSDFKQVKTLSLLDETIISTGKFYYGKQNKIRIEYLNPYKYLMVINNGQMLVKDEQQTNKINAKGSKVLQSVNQVMVDCMSGTVFQNKDFKVTAYMNKSNYLLYLVPVTPEMKKMFDRIEVYLLNYNMEVDRLVMVEKGGDATDMQFSNTKHNITLNETLFKVK